MRLRQNGFRITYHGPETPLPQLRFDAAAPSPSRSATCSTTPSSTPTATARSTSTCAARATSPRSRSSDRGIGIPRDEQKKIFDRFHRVGTGLVHDVKGSGLGLSIVRHIVEAHGGTVAVESRPGEGSTFSLLPADRPRDGRGAAGRTAHPAALRGLRTTT